MPEDAPVDYDTYRLTAKDRLKYGLYGILLSAAVSRIFYKSLVLFLAAGPLAAFLFPVMMKEKLKEDRKKRIAAGFREAIGILSGYLSAGFSMENAFSSSVSQLSRLYGEEAEITREWRTITGGIHVNRPVEELLWDFGKRSGEDDIRGFAEVFSIARKTGGNLSDIIDRTASVIRDKMAVAEEIENITADRRFEQKVMYAVPFLLVLYLDVTNPGFLDVMYETVLGRAVMTACLLLLYAAYRIAQKILDIKV